MADEIIIETTSQEVVEIGVVGPQGPQGPKGDPGDVAGLPLSTQGDLLYRGASENQRLGIGSSGQVLKVSGGLPAWANESGAVTSVNGENGAVVLDGSDIDTSGNDDLAAFVTYEFADGNGIYYPLPDSTLNSKRVYRTTTGHHVFFQSLRWHITDGSPITANIIESSDDDNAAWPWLSAWDGSIEKAQLSTVVGRARSTFLFVGDSIPNSSVSGLSSVAASGAYNDLTGKPTSLTPSSHAASHAAGIKASYNGQVAGMSTNVLIRAVNAGTAGNSITLTFDGADEIDTVLAAWNAANTSNTAGLVSGDGSQVPDNGEEIALSGGVAGGSDPFKNIDQDLGTTDSPNFAGATINQNGAWGLTVNSGNNQTNTADFTGGSSNYNLIRVQNTDGESSFYMACTGSGYSGSNFGESNAGQVSLEVNGGGTNKVGLIGNRFGPLCLGADDKIQLRLDLNGTTISDPTTVTKKVRLSASSVSAGQTRVVTFPDKNITLDDAGDARTPTAHSHGNINSSGQVGSTSGLPLKTGTAGVVEAGAFGTSAGTFCEGNDARLSNARTPTAHTHAASDITSGLAASATTDTTNASNISSGTLAPARMGSGTPSASNYLRGDGSWQAVTAGVGGSTGATDNALLRADGTGGASVQDSALVIDDATTSTQNNVALRNNHSETNSALVLAPKGNGAFYIGASATGTTAGGNSRGQYAVDLQWSPRFAATNVASGNRSIILNGENNTSSGGDAISGGTSNMASGVAAVALGLNATASGNYTFAAGYRPTASGANGTVALGANTSATINGQFAFSSGRPSGSGISQFTVFTLYGNTTGTGTTELFGGADQGGAVRLSVPSGHIMHGLVHIIGTKNDGLTVATYSRQVAIKNVGGTTSLVGSVTLVGADLASGTSISITANDTNDALKIDCTGPTAGETWRWTAAINFAQRTYAN